MNRQQNSTKKKRETYILPHPADNRRDSSLLWPWLIVAATVLLTAAVRIRLLNMPLERDEGEYAYLGQLLLQGMPPYLSAYSMKLPGVYAAYALIMSLFGQTAAGIHLGLTLINAGTILMIFLLAKKMFNPLAGAVAAAAYGILSLGSAVLGTAAHATHFVVLFAVPGALLMLEALEQDRLIFYFFSGLLLGTAFLMKQHAVFFILFSGLYLVSWQIKTRRAAGPWPKWLAQQGVFAAGVFLPFLLSCLLLYLAGVFDQFRFWTFTYASQYVSELPLSRVISTLRSQTGQTVKPAWPLWLAAAAGLAYLLWRPAARRKIPFIAGFTVCSFLAVTPGGYFREHYFILMLPAVALLTGAACGWLSPSLEQPRRPWAIFLLFCAAAAYPLYQDRDLFFRLPPREACRRLYKNNPFPESAVIADYVKKHTTKRDRIAVIGSEPQIYFYADRLSATGYIYTYGLMEIQPHARAMQEEMIREVESAKPKYLIFVDIDLSWLPEPGSDSLIFAWLAAYASQNYKTAGIVTIRPSGQTEYLWDQDAVSHEKTESSVVYIYERLEARPAGTPKVKPMP
jgi:hypothetical protein